MGARTAFEIESRLVRAWGVRAESAWGQPWHRPLEGLRRTLGEGEWKPKLDFVTLAVADLDRAALYLECLGWPAALEASGLSP